MVLASKQKESGASKTSFLKWNFLADQVCREAQVDWEEVQVGPEGQEG